ncbi:DgyrCDS6135 [Dimorphilus gyrociliatus]|uniref:DgyrCDS6135 n=1 Tax=Dimorphilus gyrociliatus TaxID=2664684 RepID=A0A7I8VM46_9ANNE|nr:DgyrCDS6135 [Dimorphilus gyrociliatus]
MFKHVISAFSPRILSSTLLSNKMSTMANYKALNVTQHSEFVKHVEVNRPEKRNAMNMDFFNEMIDCFNTLSFDPDCRVIVLSGAGKMFSGGIDLQTLMALGQDGADIEDVGRKSFMLTKVIPKLQESFNVIEKCRKPVIAAIHNGCIGGGVDMVTACDIRYCTQDAFFEIKEVKVGLAADIGTLQRLPKVIGNNSLVRELVYSGRQMHSDEALQAGLVNKVFPTKEAMMKGALEMATQISELSPIAVQTSNNEQCNVTKP